MNLYILDNDHSIVEFYKNFFKNEFPKIQLHFFHDTNSFLTAVNQNQPDFVIIEFDIDNPFDVYQTLQDKFICFIVISRFFSERIVVESLKHGAYDYIHKSNLKYGYFKNVLARALLDLPRWQKINQEYLNIKTYPEFQKYDQLLKNLALEVNQISLDRDIGLPEFIEGKSYNLNFFTVRIPISRELLSYLLIEEELQRLHSEWLKNAIKIVEHFNGQIWIKKSDSFTAVFNYNNYLDPIIASLEIKSYMIQILSTMEIDNLHVICALEQGMVIYNKEKENLYSEAINLTSHMVERLPLKYHLYITQNIYNGLNKRAKNYFFKEDNPFEGSTIYRFEYIS
ncbi:MAG: hypothetical protein KatS3mg129_3282 [Leptospiraceae bacterium]|nr:MAG: hypothetical protein KatS3mg129_0703 [Leptospiraceae bacterium]GIX43549.1 MAG: hypothetical protein KatS3mg129_3282 [Leptospiraceae bacterium]